MKVRALYPALLLTWAPWVAAAEAGLVVPQADAWWPHWQFRVALQTTAGDAPRLSRPLDAAPLARPWQGASVLGDFYFALPSYGAFRASGGLMSGAQGGVPLLSVPAGPRLGFTVQGGAAGGIGDGATTTPYLGLGFTGTGWNQSFSLTADVGVVADRPAASLALGRALLGNQGFELALREMRLSPVLQLGMRYTF